MKKASEPYGASQKINIRIIWVPEEKEKEKGTETLFKGKMTEKFPNMGWETDSWGPKDPKYVESIKATIGHYS